MSASKEDSTSLTKEQEIARINQATHPFAVFGLNPSKPINDTIIRKRYLYLARKVHPDHNNSSNDATQAFKKLEEANSTLKDPIALSELSNQFSFKSATNTPANNATQNHKADNNFTSSPAHDFNHTKPTATKSDTPQYEPNYEAAERLWAARKERQKRQEQEKMRAAQQASQKQEEQEMHPKQKEAQPLVVIEIGIWSAIKNLARQVFALLMNKPKITMPQDDIEIEVVESMPEKDFFTKINEQKVKHMQKNVDERINLERVNAQKNSIQKTNANFKHFGFIRSKRKKSSPPNKPTKPNKNL